MPQEIVVLALGVALLFFHISLQAILATMELGRAWNASARDERIQVKGLYAGRAERALKNYLETFTALIALSLALAVLNKTGGIATTGAWIWLLARLVYIPLYLMGIPYIRSAVWVVAALGLFLMFIALFM
ncbi:MAPEG family protein [Terrihabitans soli]